MFGNGSYVSGGPCGVGQGKEGRQGPDDAEPRGKAAGEGRARESREEVWHSGDHG